MATVKFYLRNPKIDDKLRKDEVSIFAKFTIDRKKRFEITLDEKIQPKHWDFNSQQVKPSYRGHYEINSYLEDFKYKLMTLYRENRELPFDKFKNLATHRSEQKKTLFLALDQFIDCYHGEKAYGTYQKCLSLKNQLVAFNAITPIDLPTLDYNFYDKFKKSLSTIPNPNYKGWSLEPDRSNYSNTYRLVHNTDGLPVGLFDDTIFKYIIVLKTFCRWAEKHGIQVHPSYKSWEVINRKHDPISLTKEELEKLESVTLPKTENIARDYLLLQCRTGQRISDIKRFDLKNFSDNKWTFTQKKGNRLSAKTTAVHFKGFCAPALDILQKYNWKLPDLSEQKINQNIKTACKKAGIDSPVEYVRWAANKRIVLTCPKYELLSNHSGRKTFITLALQSGMSIDYVMELTGIVKYDTIRHYKAKFEDSAIEEQLEKISGKTTLRKAL